MNPMTAVAVATELNRTLGQSAAAVEGRPG